MKGLFRVFLINLAALFVTTKILPGLTYQGGFKTLLIGALVFSVINLLVVPILKVMFLPLNLLTLGLFAWVVNVVALYVLVAIIPQFRIVPFTIYSLNFMGIIIPEISLNTLMVAVIASFLIGFIAHFVEWLIKS